MHRYEKSGCRCVCVCLGLQMGLYWDRRPLYGPLQLSLVVPTLPAFSPSRECHNPSVCADWPPTLTGPLPPDGPHLLGVLIQGWGYWVKLMGPGQHLLWNPHARPVDGFLTRVGARAICPSWSLVRWNWWPQACVRDLQRTQPQKSYHPRLAVSRCNPSSSSLTVGTSASRQKALSSPSAYLIHTYVIPSPTLERGVSARYLSVTPVPAY